MKIPDHIIRFINIEPLVLWAGNIGPEGFCSFVRSAGLSIPEENDDHLTFYLTKPYASELLKNLPEGIELSLLVTSLASFESYQFKGELVSNHTASETEEEQIRPIITRALNALEAQGMNSNILPPFINGPKLGIKLRLKEIFDQAPKQGAGKIISA